MGLKQGEQPMARGPHAAMWPAINSYLARQAPSTFAKVVGAPLDKNHTVTLFWLEVVKRLPTTGLKVPFAVVGHR